MGIDISNVRHTFKTSTFGVSAIERPVHVCHDDSSFLYGDILNVFAEFLLEQFKGLYAERPCDPLKNQHSGLDLPRFQTREVGLFDLGMVSQHSLRPTLLHAQEAHPFPNPDTDRRGGNALNQFPYCHPASMAVR
jgi:hypothetical protein